jgi:hypothetical protein
VNFALISVRSSSRGANSTSSPERADPHAHPAAGAQAHLDPLALAVEEGDVLEGPTSKSASSSRLTTHRRLRFELRRDARAVVVGRLRASPGP